MQGRRQKNFQEGTNGKKVEKCSKKDRKIAILSLFQGVGNEKKTEKIAKNTEK